MMRFTNELIHILQLNKQLHINNVARLSHIYDEGTNLVDISNASKNNSTQAQAQSKNRQNAFPGYHHPYHLSQMITYASQYPSYNMIQVSASQQQSIK